MKNYFNANGVEKIDPEFRVSLTADGTAAATRAIAIAELAALSLDPGYGYGEGATAYDCAHNCSYVLAASGWTYAGEGRI